MYAEILNEMRELHSRVTDGIHVRLLWCQHANRVAVDVNDTKTGDAFTIDVRDGEQALDVFHHPYAYAALRGVTTRVALAVAA